MSLAYELQQVLHDVSRQATLMEFKPNHHKGMPIESFNIKIDNIKKYRDIKEKRGQV